MKSHTDMLYQVLIDEVDRNQWREYAGMFSDYSIYQTWPYQEVRADEEDQEISRVLVKDANNDVVLMSHVRIKQIVPLGLKIGYLQWGPLIFKKDGTCHCTVEALKMLRQAYLETRTNILRVVPNFVDTHANERYVEMLGASGFERCLDVSPYHTTVIRLDRSEEELRKELHQSWRRMLRKAEAAGLEAREYTDQAPFEILEKYYSDLTRRKGFKGMSPQVFSRTQSHLSDSEKMSVVVVYDEGEPVTVHVTSNLGDTGILLLAASNERGYQCRASYLAWWTAVTISNRRGMKEYDLGGIDFCQNPGVARFKAGMGGQEQSHVGAFDAFRNAVTKNAFRIGERIYNGIKSFDR